jgi:hypothetical protein
VGRVRLEGLSQCRIPVSLSEFVTRDLPVCSSVPEPTASPHIRLKSDRQKYVLVIRWQRNCLGVQNWGRKVLLMYENCFERSRNVLEYADVEAWSSFKAPVTNYHKGTRRHISEDLNRQEPVCRKTKSSVDLLERRPIISIYNNLKIPKHINALILKIL